MPTIRRTRLAAAHRAYLALKAAEQHYLDLRADILERYILAHDVEPGEFTLDVRSISTRVLSRRNVREVYGAEGLQRILQNMPERPRYYVRVKLTDEKPMPEPLDEEWADLVAVKPAKADKAKSKSTKPKVVADPYLEE
jgi:hypothetical protein